MSLLRALDAEEKAERKARYRARGTVLKSWLCAGCGDEVISDLDHEVEESLCQACEEKFAVQINHQSPQPKEDD